MLEQDAPPAPPTLTVTTFAVAEAGIVVTTRAPLPPVPPLGQVAGTALPPPAPSAVTVATAFAGMVKVSGAPVKVKVWVMSTARGDAVVAAAGTLPAPDRTTHNAVTVPAPDHLRPLPGPPGRRSDGVIEDRRMCLPFTDLSQLLVSVV
ncbi:hypothetical protein ACFW3D_30280 [Streptomyces sp. NPDC058864]